MARSVPEWIGRTQDSPVPSRVRLRVLRRDNFRCQCGECGYREIMQGEAWQTDHTIALVNGGENRESNLRSVIAAHHKAKTRDDVKEKAKVDRISKKHAGIKRSRTILGGRRFNGEPIRYARER